MAIFLLQQCNTTMASKPFAPAAQLQLECCNDPPQPTSGGGHGCRVSRPSRFFLPAMRVSIAVVTTMTTATGMQQARAECSTAAGPPPMEHAPKAMLLCRTLKPPFADDRPFANLQRMAPKCERKSMWNHLRSDQHMVDQQTENVPQGIDRAGRTIYCGKINGENSSNPPLKDDKPKIRVGAWRVATERGFHSFRSIVHAPAIATMAVLGTLASDGFYYCHFDA